MEKLEIERKIEQYYILKAVLIAPLGAIFGAFAGGALFGDGTFTTRELISELVGPYIGGAMVFVLPIAYVSTFLFGYPLFWVLRKIKLVYWWSLLVAGALLGMAICLLFLGVERELLGQFTMSGAAVGVLAWWVYSGRDKKYAL